MKKALFFMALLTLPAAWNAAAQAVPTPQFGSAVSQRIVDAADGHALAGVVVVVRWQWAPYRLGGFHSSSGFFPTGEAIHVGEDVTAADGRFRISGWGPALHGAGRMMERAPWVLAFRSGYEPLALDASALTRPLAMRPAAGTPAEQAAAIARFQHATEGVPSLRWRQPDDGWRAMPRMVLALHREKARLGDDGGPILGAHVLHGRSGYGELAIAEREPRGPQRPAILIEWRLRRVDGAPGAQRAWQAKTTGTDRSGRGFYVSPWRLPSVAPPGWEVDPDAPPTIRAYALDYRHSAPRRWTEEGGTVVMEKLPAQRDAIVAEARAWRQDLDGALGADPDEARLVALLPMVALLDLQCRELTPDLRRGICFEPSSPAVAALERSRRNPVMVTETEEGAQAMRTVVVGSGSSQALAVQAVTQPAGGPVVAMPARGAGAVTAPQRIPVSGFSIEPVEK